MRVVVAASWGSPACWGVARYLLGDPRGGGVVEVESRTSLLAVLEYAGRLGRVEALIVGSPSARVPTGSEALPPSRRQMRSLRRWRA